MKSLYANYCRITSGKYQLDPPAGWLRHSAKDGSPRKSGGAPEEVMAIVEGKNKVRNVEKKQKKMRRS